jgi:hypothetical protein
MWASVTLVGHDITFLSLQRLIKQQISVFRPMEFNVPLDLAAGGI